MMGAIIALAPVVFGLLALSALFSAAETALTGASRARMHQLEREGDRAAQRVNRLLSDQETMIGAVLLGNSLINILASALTTQVITRAIPGAWGVAAATGIMTVLILVFAEVLPKTLAILRSDDVARFLSAPALLIVRVFGPIIYTIQYVVRRTLKLFGVRLTMEMDVLAAHEEIRGAVEYHHAEGLVETQYRWMLGGVLDLAEMDVSEVMVHRNFITAIDADQPPREILAAMLGSGHSRAPLYRVEPENIVGVLHNKDLLAA
ncbi:MAG TPA: CNNM domain-containing protein, partial [Phenylobacterium sp.]|nr:CNNM domain-containing protein [Phenylobacterium sp.]